MVVSPRRRRVAAGSISTGVVMSSRTEVVWRSVRLRAILRSTSRSVEIPATRIFGVDDGDRSDVMVEHFVDGVGYGSFQRNRRDFSVTKFQTIYKPLWLALAGASS